MPIDLKTEEAVTLAEAAKHLPALRKGRRIHLSTLYRWTSRGVSGVRLESLKLGRTVVTSKEALQRFAEKLAQVSSQTTGPARPVIAEPRIEQELERRGL
jgi:Protein of unknown function (DUF1580)